MHENTILAPFPSSWADVVKENYGKESLDITFQLTEDCCMACSYCYQHSKTNNKMTWETAKLIIDKIFNGTVFSKDNFSDLIDNNNYQTLIFTFIGGEPLMEIDLIDKILDYTLMRMIEMKSPWLTTFRASICTNGLLYFTPRVQEVLTKYKNTIVINLTIDGNKELHDSCRVDLNGNGTYDRIVAMIEHYRNNYGPLLNTKLTLCPDNINYLYDAIVNLINLNFNEIYANCVFEKGWDISHAKILYSELKKLGDFFIENNLYNRVFFRFFSEDLYQPLSEEQNINWCGGTFNSETSPNYFSVNYTGNIYPCIRYMESSLGDKQKPIVIDNIYNNLSNNLYQDNIKLISNISRRSQSTDECYYCPIASGCSWCSAFNYETFGTPNKRATYICIMHQAASLANAYFLNKLYKKLNINKRAKIYLQAEKALNIIDENEYNHLLDLSQQVEEMKD